MKSQVVRIHRHGDASVLQIESAEIEDPGPGEVLIRQTAIGLNFAEIYQRQGAHGPHSGGESFPLVLGSQGAGVVEAVGEGVTNVDVGDRVGCIQPGSYASHRLAPAWRAVRLPDGVSDELAAGWLLRGLTAEYLLKRLYVLGAGDRALIHAAAGGMGVILTQWARRLGAFVVGTVGSSSKSELALANGCHVVIDYSVEDFVRRTLEVAEGGVHVVYDAVGKAVFVRSLDCLRPRGMAINFGTASGDVEGFDLQLLHHKSLTVCRPTLRSFIATPEELSASAAAFFAFAAADGVDLDISRRYALADVRQAHIDLESRATTGVGILVP
jgi:NADPH2:quinone reductase